MSRFLYMDHPTIKSNHLVKCVEFIIIRSRQSVASTDASATTLRHWSLLTQRGR